MPDADPITAAGSGDQAPTAPGATQAAGGGDASPTAPGASAAAGGGDQSPTAPGASAAAGGGDASPDSPSVESPAGSGDQSPTSPGAITAAGAGASTPGTAATGTMSLNQTPSEGDTLTLGSIVYTFRAVPAVAYDIGRDGDADDLASSIWEEVTGEGIGAANPDLTISEPDDQPAPLQITALAVGTAGNSLATTFSNVAAQITFGAATLQGGIDPLPGGVGGASAAGGGDQAPTSPGAAAAAGSGDQSPTAPGAVIP